MLTLRTLNLRNNDLGKVLAKGGYKRYGTIKLQNVDLSKNGIHSLLFIVFEGHSYLETLNLSDNVLSDFSPDVSFMVRLKVLDLSKNKIKYFSQLSTMQNISRIAKQTHLKIDLSHNILECSCPSLVFLRWMFDNQELFYNKDSYKCKSDNGTIIVLSRLQNTVSVLQKSCASYTVLTIGISVLVVAVILILVGGLLYRYRWRLRYAYYMTRSKYKSDKLVNTEMTYAYNAFISYSEEEKDFVINECIPNLEEHEHLRLCIHQRDFIPGEEISQNITNGIHNSNKTICIITRSFLDSYYCMFEFNMARMESIYSREGHNILFLVFYEQILPRELPLIMLELVQHQSYIEYPDDLQGNVVFWNKIKEAIE
ncbi:Hypothetical predicted protein [Mytilus galloprovincialis]|uniref:TIR domain-containing protein n=1 Tax=Mytilus galloprovincialis TaxID=29158 RepID=A0A8B6FT58_MYTGA|nr:Hypothetical predicted protein [Mytilus galloprovincialis]